MSEIWIQGGIGIVALGVLYKVATFVISTVFERLIAHFDNTNATFKSHLDMLHAEHKDERQEMRKIHQDDRIRWETAHLTRYEHYADKVSEEVRSSIQSALTEGQHERH